jgi:hypothetical protein
MWGREGGRGTTTMIAGGEVALLASSSNGTGKDSGERWQGDNVDDDGGRGNGIFIIIIVIVVHFGGVTPSWRWGGRAVTGMLRRLEGRRRRRATRWCWRGMDPTINIIL